MADTTATAQHDQWLRDALGLDPATYTTARSSDVGGGEPNHSVDSGATEPNQSVVPGASEPNQSIDPGASEPNQSIDPGASEPNQSVDPGASEPNQSVDPSVGEPNQSVDPSVSEPNQSVDPGASEPNQSVEPGVSEPIAPSGSSPNNPYAGTTLADPWQAGYNDGRAQPDATLSAPSPYAPDAQTVYLEGVLAGQEVARGTRPDPAHELDDRYGKALLAKDWESAAEALNGFNSTDIKQRLAQLSPDEIASLHEGAINNPRVGPDSQVAKMTGNAADAVEGDRPLTPDEISAAQTIFGNTIDYGAVTLSFASIPTHIAAQSPTKTRSVTVGNTINLDADCFVPGSSKLTSEGKSVLIHELTHVWQYQHEGWSYAAKALYAQNTEPGGGYDWRRYYDQGLGWDQWNPEAQAQAVQDYNDALTKANAGSTDPHVYETISTLHPFVEHLLK
jgi:Domain of unknown function (DUF4157)